MGGGRLPEDSRLVPVWETQKASLQSSGLDPPSPRRSETHLGRPLLGSFLLVLAPGYHVEPLYITATHQSLQVPHTALPVGPTRTQAATRTLA